MKTPSLKTTLSILFAFLLITTGIALVHAKTKDIIFFPTHEVSNQKLLENQNESKKISKISKNLANNTVFSVKYHEGKVYAATLNGLSILDLKTQRFNNLTMADGLGSNLINDIGVDFEGNLWAGTLESISKISGDKIVNYSGLAAFKGVITYDIHTTHNRELWFSTNKGLFHYRTDKKWKTYDLERGNLPVSVINVMTDDRNGDIWAANNVLFHYPFAERREKLMSDIQWQPYLPMDASGINVTSMMTDSNNQLWIGTANRGIFVYNIDRNDWTHLHDLSSYFIADILEDEEKNIWVATSQGVIKIEGEIWLIMNKGNNMPFTNCNSIDTFIETIWVGCDDGLLQLEDNEWTIFKESGKETRPFKLLKQQIDLIEGEKVRQKVREIQGEKSERAAINRSRSGTFEDILVPGREWVSDTVFPLMDKGILEPKPKFFPERVVTKEEVLKMGMAAKGFSVEDRSDSFAPFCDSQKDQWYNPWLNKALEHEFIERDRCFGIGEKMTRKAALKMLFSIFKVPLQGIKQTKFSDVTTEADINLIETAVGLGIVKGYSTEAAKTISLKEKHGLQEVFLTGESYGVNVTRYKEALSDMGFFKGDTSEKDYNEKMINAVADYQASRGIYSFGDKNFGAIDSATRWKLMAEEVPTGFIEGVKKTFDPDGYFNRAQMAVVLKKLIDLQSEE